MRNGWFRDNYRHSLAARGIKTSFYRKEPKGFYDKMMEEEIRVAKKVAKDDKFISEDQIKANKKDIAERLFQFSGSKTIAVSSPSPIVQKLAEEMEMEEKIKKLEEEQKKELDENKSNMSSKKLAEELKQLDLDMIDGKMNEEEYNEKLAKIEKNEDMAWFGKKQLTPEEVDAKLNEEHAALKKIGESKEEPEKKEDKEEKSSMANKKISDSNVLFGASHEKPQDYIDRSLKRNSNDGLKEFTRDVKYMITNPKGEYDNEWKSYEDAAGRPKKLSKDPVNRSEERAAALMGRVLTQENMQPLIDKEKGRNVRGFALDILFGRDIR